MAEMKFWLRRELYHPQRQAEKALFFLAALETRFLWAKGQDSDMWPMLSWGKKPAFGKVGAEAGAGVLPRLRREGEAPWRLEFSPEVGKGGSSLWGTRAKANHQPNYLLTRSLGNSETLLCYSVHQ